MSAPIATDDDHVWEVVIIGAGQAGLAAAHDLTRRGLRPSRDFLVLDGEDRPGGAWRHRWDSLTFDHAHGIADLPGLALGKPDPTTPSSVVVEDYYGRYEQMFGLEVVRPARVRAVRATGVKAPELVGAQRGEDAPPAVAGEASIGEPSSIPRDTLLAVDYEIATEADGAGESPTTRALMTRMIISATGTWTHPYIPRIPGIETFQGPQLHTVDFVRAEDFAGQRTVVVGGGLSAVQFLLQLAPVTETIWATRRPPNFTDVTFDQIWGIEVERAVDRRTSQGQRPASVVRTTGIPRWPDYLRGIAEGVLVSRGMFDRVGERAVQFSPAATASRGEVEPGRGPTGGLGPSGADELVEPDSWRPYAEPTWVDVDVVFWNTGFRHAITHLAPLRLREPGGGIRMLGRVTVAKDSRVLLVGYGSSASTTGATHAGREAARVAVKRLGPS